MKYQDFLKIEMRVGTVVEVAFFEKAHKPAYKLRIDFGAEIGEKKTSAQITDHYNVARLMGKQVIAVTNFPPKQIGNFMSEVLVLGIHDENGAVSLLNSDHELPNGSRVL